MNGKTGGGPVRWNTVECRWNDGHEDLDTKHWVRAAPCKGNRPTVETWPLISDFRSPKICLSRAISAHLPF